MEKDIFCICSTLQTDARHITSKLCALQADAINQEICLGHNNFECTSLLLNCCHFAKKVNALPKHYKACKHDIIQFNAVLSHIFKVRQACKTF